MQPMPPMPDWYYVVLVGSAVRLTSDLTAAVPPINVNLKEKVIFKRSEVVFDPAGIDAPPSNIHVGMYTFTLRQKNYENNPYTLMSVSYDMVTKEFV